VRRLRTERRGSLPKPVALVALLCGTFNLASSAQTQLATSGITGIQTPELSSQSQVWLHAEINTGSFPDLRWPDFSDYGKHVEEFYELNGGSLWWVKGMEPTTQAREMIALMLQADQNGLSADDDDGPRRNDRLAKLEPATRQPTEAEAVKFDLALTRILS
jgi:hypothetical protein